MVCWGEVSMLKEGEEKEKFSDCSEERFGKKSIQNFSFQVKCIGSLYSMLTSEQYKGHFMMNMNKC